MHYSLLLLTRPNLRRIFLLFLAVPCSLWGLSSPTRDWTRGHNSESAKSQPLDRQETSRINYFIPVEPARMLSNCDAAEDSWESLGLQGEEIKPVNLNGNQLWIVFGRTDAEAPRLWSPDVKSQLTGKGPDAGKDWRQQGKRSAKDEMVGWQHQLNEHKSEQTPGDSEGQRSLVCCSPRGCKESDVT